MRSIKAGITNVNEGHYHTVEMDNNGTGVTTYASHMSNHAHKVVNGIVMEAEGHTHDITMMGVPIHNMETEESVSERPLSPTEEEAMSNDKTETSEAIEEKAETEMEVEIVEEAEVEVEEKSEEVVEEKAESSEEVMEEVEKEDDYEEEFVARDPNESIPMVNLLSADPESLQHGDLVNFNEKMYRVTKIATAQSPIFKFLEIDAQGKDCDNVLNVNADELSSQSETKSHTSEDEVSNESLTKELHNNSDKENETMAEQVVDTIDIDNVAKEADVEIKKEAAPAVQVSEPQVAELVEKTGEAIIKESDAQEKSDYTPRESDELAALKAQMAQYQDQIAALQQTKMHYQEQSRNQAQFTEKEQANAVMLAKMMNKRDVFDTKLGMKMKAITTVDQFLSNFSSNIYTEMEQQLVVAPMFERVAVDARTLPRTSRR